MIQGSKISNRKVLNFQILFLIVGLFHLSLFQKFIYGSFFAFLEILINSERLNMKTFR